MLQNNNVTLCGIVMPGKTEQFISAQGHQILSFDLRTREVWTCKDRDINHFEYHKITLKDAGNFKTLSRYAGLVSAGNKLLVQGKLRYKITKDNNTIRRYPEIEASAIDLLAIVDKTDLIDLDICNHDEHNEGSSALNAHQGESNWVDRHKEVQVS